MLHRVILLSAAPWEKTHILPHPKKFLSDLQGNLALHWMGKCLVQLPKNSLVKVSSRRHMEGQSRSFVLSVINVAQSGNPKGFCFLLPMNMEFQSSQKERVGEKLNTTFISNTWIQTKTENLLSYSLVKKKKLPKVEGLTMCSVSWVIRKKF